MAELTFNFIHHIIMVAQANKTSKNTTNEIETRSSATAKSTARPSCLVALLYDIYRETNNRSTANQPLVRNWP